MKLLAQLRRDVKNWTKPRDSSCCTGGRQIDREAQVRGRPADGTSSGMNKFEARALLAVGRELLVVMKMMLASLMVLCVLTVVCVLKK